MLEAGRESVAANALKVPYFSLSFYAYAILTTRHSWSVEHNVHHREAYRKALQISFSSSQKKRTLLGNKNVLLRLTNGNIVTAGNILYPPIGITLCTDKIILHIEYSYIL